MPMISADKAKPEYDVVIVGSGAAGGQSAYTLTLAGLKCVMLEAGRSYDPTTETPMFNTPAQAPLFGNSTPDKPFGFYDATVGGGWEVPGEPYTSAAQAALRGIQMVAAANAGRADQPLGTHLASQRPL